MPRYDKEAVLDALQGRFIDFYEEQGVVLKRDGGEFRGGCLLHGGDGPNFTVDETGQWYCHSQCQQGGDVFSFLQRLDNIDFPEALERIAVWAGASEASPGVVTPRRHARPIPRVSRDAPDAPLIEPELARVAHGLLLASPKMLAWLLKQRGLTRETLERYQVGMDQHPEDMAAGVWRVTFPVFDAEGGLTNIRRHLFPYKADLTDERRRELNKTLPWDKGLRADLFPLPAIQGAKTVLLVEGEADALLANQMGFVAVTGTSGAGNWKPWWTETLRTLGVGAVTILYDGDEAGDKGRLKPAADLDAAGIAVRIAHYPEGVKDLTEWVIGQGATAADLQAVIDVAVPFIQLASAVTPAQVHVMGTAPAPDPGPFPMPAEPDWPEADPAMFHGLAGDIVRAIDPHTEADPVALLVQTLAAFGNATGRRAHFTAEADQHFGNLFAVLVGISAKGRKGTSWGHVRRLFEAADPVWGGSCLQSGLSSGEGLIWHVRDPIEKQVKNKKTGELETVTEDAGVDDKRLLVQESEFASVLRVAGRDGNTLSAILRDAWDRGRLQTMTKNNAAHATGAHISLVGHVTADELRRELSTTEAGNGFANRFLWVCVRRSKELPEGGQLQEADLFPLRARLTEAIQAAADRDCLRRDDAARLLWLAVYHDLSEGGPGLSGAVTSRGEAQTMRLALLYALLDGDPCIRAEHLTAALALWEYVQDSARYIFGDSLGDPVADDILRALRSNPTGMSRNDIRELFGRNQSSARIGQALALLLRHNRALATVEADTGGRPAERWHAVRPGGMQ